MSVLTMSDRPYPPYWGAFKFKTPFAKITVHNIVNLDSLPASRQLSSYHGDMYRHDRWVDSNGMWFK